MAITPSGDITFFEQNRLTLDIVFNSNSLTYTDRGGTVRVTWNGAISQFNADQATRKSLFDASQNSRADEFNTAQSTRKSTFDTAYAKWNNDFNTGQLLRTNQFNASQTSQAFEFNSAQNLREAQWTTLLNLSGFAERGDWKVGLTVTSMREIVRYQGNFYRFNGAFPHTITATSPSADGNWLNLGTLTDALLQRNNLSDIIDVPSAQTNLRVGAILSTTNNRIIFKEYAETPLTFYNVSIPLNFITDGASYSLVKRTDGSNKVATGLLGAQSDAPLTMRRYRPDGIGPGAQIYLGQDGSVQISNAIKDTSLFITADGDLRIGGYDILHAGNAGTATLIGSDIIKATPTSQTLGGTIPGTTLRAGLAGTWRILTSEPITFAGATQYITQYRRVA